MGNKETDEVVQCHVLSLQYHMHSFAFSLIPIAGATARPSPPEGTKIVASVRKLDDQLGLLLVSDSKEGEPLGSIPNNVAARLVPLLSLKRLRVKAAQFLPPGPSGQIKVGLQVEVVTASLQSQPVDDTREFVDVLKEFGFWQQMGTMMLCLNCETCNLDTQPK